MADGDARPLTDEERAELEALRAEKARRERAELEALRAEEAAAAQGAAGPGTRSATAPAAAAPQDAPRPTKEPAPQPALQPASRPAPQPASRSAADAPVIAQDPSERTFGQRMVLSEEQDADGLPSMPPAQKLIIGICLVALAGYIIYLVLGTTGILS